MDFFLVHFILMLLYRFSFTTPSTFILFFLAECLSSLLATMVFLILSDTHLCIQENMESIYLNCSSFGVASNPISLVLFAILKWIDSHNLFYSMY